MFFRSMRRLSGAAVPDEQIEIDVYSSHFSRRQLRRDVTLHWSLSGIDS